jgi:cytochrome c oxidase subunit 1
LLGGFGNYLVPLMVGANDMAFPRLNAASVWVFAAACLVLVASWFVPEGPAAAGWTNYPPLSARYAFSGVGIGFDLWLAAVFLDFISVLMSGINVLTTTWNLRSPGLTWERLPLMVWTQCIAAVLFLLSVGPLMAAICMLWFDRHWGAGFFAPEKMGDPLLWQHLFWFFGHPEVYVILLPALGILCETFPTFARKPLPAPRLIVAALLASAVLSFLVWAHHMFVSGMNVRLATPFSITTILISVPFAIVVFALLANLWQARLRLTVAMWFALGTLASFLVGGVTGVFLGSAALDVHLHDTYFVVAHFHYTLFPSVIFAGFAGTYFWFPKMWGRALDERLGKLHFWFTFVPFHFVFLPLFWLGVHGHVRRIASPTYYAFLEPLSSLHVVATIAAFVLVAAQFLFVANCALSLRRGQLADANPWGATTLEWSVPSPPPLHNFMRRPQVVRAPYQYFDAENGEVPQPQWEARDEWAG